MLPVTVFSDFACPYSYVTESALWRVADSSMSVQYRAFELFPDRQEIEGEPITPGEWDDLRPLAEAEGLELIELDFRPRTRKAHEAARFARQHDLEPALRSEIYSAYWSEGLDIGRIDVLMELAARVEIEPEDLKIALDIDKFADDVERDLEVARRLHVPGSPTMFLGSGPRARVLAGAHDARRLGSLIQEASRAWHATNEDV
ncbi:MAG: DsbA family protein [Gemmatimonadota bacterium]